MTRLCFIAVTSFTAVFRLKLQSAMEQEEIMKLEEDLCGLREIVLIQLQSAVKQIKQDRH